MQFGAIASGSRPLVHVAGVRAFKPRREAIDPDVPFGGFSVDVTC